MKKKIFAALLALGMVCSLLPGAALAADAPDTVYVSSETADDHYPTLAAAYNAVADGGTIHVKTNVTLSGGVSVAKSCTIQGEATDGTLPVIKMSSVSDITLFTVSGGAALTLKNIIIKGAGKEAQKKKEFIKVTSQGSKVILEDGAVIQDVGMVSAGNESGELGIIRLTNGAELVMKEGAEIKDCSAFSGVIRLHDDNKRNPPATFTMEGGSIKNCDSHYANEGNVVYINHGVMVMSGGSITECGQAGNCYGTIFLHANADSTNQFQMSGGVIENNKAKLGGGIYIANGTVTLSGVPVIRNNEGTSLPGNASNIYLLANQTVTVGTEHLGEGAEVYVYTVSTPAEGSDVAIATGANAGDVNYFRSDNAAQAGILFCDGTTDTPVIGNGHTHSASAGKLFLSVSANEENLTKVRLEHVLAEGKGDTVTLTVAPADENLSYALLDKDGNEVKGWTAPSGGKAVFEGLSGETEYQLVTKVKDTEKETTALNGKGTGLKTPAVPAQAPEIKRSHDGTVENGSITDKVSVVTTAQAGFDYALMDGEGNYIDPATGTAADDMTDPWRAGIDGELVWDKLDAEKAYQVVRRPSAPNGENIPAQVVAQVLPNLSAGQLIGGYDEASDKASITVSPADSGLKYGLVDEDGNAVGTWKAPTGGKVVFDGLDSGKEYKIVTVPADMDTADMGPEKASGGQAVVTPAKPAAAPKADGGYVTEGGGANESKREPGSAGNADTDVVTVKTETGYHYALVDEDGKYYDPTTGTAGAEERWVAGDGTEKTWSKLPADEDLQLVKVPSASIDTDKLKSEPVTIPALTPIPTLAGGGVDTDSLKTGLEEDGDAFLTIKNTDSTLDYIVVDENGTVAGAAAGNGQDVTVGSLRPGEVYHVVTQPKGTLPEVGDAIDPSRGTEAVTPMPQAGKEISAEKGTAEGTVKLVIDPASSQVKYVLVSDADHSVAAVKTAENGKEVFDGLPAGKGYHVVTVPVTAADPAGTLTPDEKTSVGITTPGGGMDGALTAAQKGLEGVTKTKDSITISNSGASLEYTLTDKDGNMVETKPGTGEALTFTGLDTDTEYRIVIKDKTPANALPIELGTVKTDSGTGGSSSSGGSSSNVNVSKPVTETNPDGSTTTTVKKANGTVIQTTKTPDGSEITVETKKNGTVTETVKDGKGTETVTVTKPDGEQTFRVSYPGGGKGEGSGSGKENRWDGIVTLPAKSVELLADEKGSVSVKTAPDILVTVLDQRENKDGLNIKASVKADGGVNIEVTSGGKRVDGKVRVEMGGMDGNIVMEKLADGTEKPVKFSVVENGRVYVLVDSASQLRIEHKKGYFDDTVGHWAENNADFGAARELFTGTAPRQFSPEQPLSRAMLATVLSRMEESAEEAVPDFADVEEGKWYVQGIAWCAKTGIVKGNGSGMFFPQDNITRQDLAVMLYRYAEYRGMDLSAAAELTFADAGAVSGYAMEAMEWACGSALIQGKGANQLDPLGQATRAEAAAILERFIQRAVK